MILLSAGDDIEDTIRPRLDAALADVKRVQSVLYPNDDGKRRKRAVSLKQDVQQLAVLLKA